MARPSYARYQELEVTTMPAPRRVVFLYSLLSSTLAAAGRHIGLGEVEGRHTRLLKAQDIILELLATLDRETGGDLATNLASLYAYWLSELSSVNLRPDTRRLEKVKGLVDDLHQTWAHAADMLLEPQAAGAVA